MHIIFDIKLLETIRNRIEELERASFHLIGHDENETLYIVGGWFEYEPFEAPFSDKIKPVGRLKHTSISSESLEDCFALTSQELISSNDRPFRLSSDQPYRFEASDLRPHLRNKFRNAFIKGVVGCPSGEFDVIHPASVSLHFPIANFSPQSWDDVYLVQVSDTSSGRNWNTETELVALISDSANTCKVLNAVWDAFTNFTKPRRVTRNFSYMHISVHVSGVEGRKYAIISIPTRTHMIRDPHSFVLGGPTDAVMLQDGYEYFHYNVDGYQDSGWGCAYRSIQTILSWFMNNYQVVEQVPSIPEIQRCLKENDYACSDLDIGSKKWIGCIEAGTVLREFSNGSITCRILTAFTIEELSGILRTTVVGHLLEVGSPVMIGAGDYSFTIIGASRRSGSVLIADPHYSGAECEDTMTSKGFLAWKAIDQFFDFNRTRSSFINVCLPSMG